MILQNITENKANNDIRLSNFKIVEYIGLTMNNQQPLLVGASCILSVFLTSLFAENAIAGNAPSGYTRFVLSTNSENFIYVRGDDYLVPCISRNPNECPASGLNYGGKILKVKAGVVKTTKGNFFFCHENLIPHGAQGKCTAAGFESKK